jgi:hypothetical protein
MAEYHLRMKELPSSEQPRERLRDHGPTALSDAELLDNRLRIGKNWGMRRVQIGNPTSTHPIWQLFLMRNAGPGALVVHHI